jgi:cobalt-zinc-cadmium efflux system outer membrane protein
VTYPQELLKELEKRMLGDPAAMTLEEAIEQMEGLNPDIAAARSELDQARSDIITAGLRTNPQFFTDMQQVPYRVLAPNQVDVNIAYPMDISGKRKARVRSAVCVLRSVEWNYRNFLRMQRDNLYTVFVDTLVAQEMEKRASRQARESEAVLRGLERDLARSRAAGATAEVLREKRLAVNGAERSLREAKHKADDAASAFRDKRMALALLLNRNDSGAIRLRGIVLDDRSFDDTTDEAKQQRLEWLKQIAFANRPDLEAQRWNLCRAMADVEVVRASRFDDVTLLAQPYTYSPVLPDRVGWALGVTIPMPIYNRQQGNLAKAQQIVAQTRAQLASLENSVAVEVEAAYNAVIDTRDDMDWYKEVRDQTSRYDLPELTRAQRPRNDVIADHDDKLDRFVRKLIQERITRDENDYYNAIIQHRKSLLRLNTACACTVWGIDPSALDPPARLPPSVAAAIRTGTGAAARSR